MTQILQHKTHSYIGKEKSKLFVAFLILYNIQMYETRIDIY